MSADIQGEAYPDPTYDPAAPFVLDPVAHFNAINEHRAPDAPRPPFRDLQIEGDPVAKEEIFAAIQAAGGQIPFSQYMDLALYGRGGYYSQGKVDFQGGGAENHGDFL